MTRRHELLAPQLVSAWGLALVDELDGADDAAADRCRFVLQRWQRSEDRHYALLALPWSVSFFVDRGMAADARACADALAQIAAESGTPDALAALAAALGDLALLDGAVQQAVTQLTTALDLLRDMELPLARLQVQIRAGLALTAAGEREVAAQQFTAAYQAAQQLSARPLADRAARGLAALGERVEHRLGRRAADRLERGGLSQREIEIVRLVAVGRTNREIAQQLFLSPRTVDMHVRNMLGKLACRSRVEATGKAHELGLIETAPVAAGSSA